MKFNPEGLQKRENQEWSYYKIVFNYDILNDEKNSFRNNTFSNVLTERKYKKSNFINTFYEKTLKSTTENDSKKEFKQETEELKKKLREVIKDYNQKNDTNIEINYRFDLSLDNKEDSI